MKLDDNSVGLNLQQLTNTLKEQSATVQLIDRLAYAHDASIYRLVPQAVVQPQDEAQVIRLLKYAHQNRVGVTFRGGGTSLSGQTVTDGIVAETVQGWTGYKILADGKAINLQPGVIGDHVNRALAPFGRKIGPDPASIKAARVGGIVSNNASGMNSGIGLNSYYTLQDIRFILGNGNVYDTSIDADYQRFAVQEKELASGLTRLRDEIISSDDLKKKIIHKYRIKNTLGYSLNAMLDFENPLDIFAHLLIGAEGTLAFISDVTLKTLPDPEFKVTGLLIFPSLKETCNAIEFLKANGADAVELMDFNSLTTAKYLEAPPYDPDKLKPGSASLLCEFQKDSLKEAEVCAQYIETNLGKYKGKVLSGFFNDETNRLKLWTVRKSLFTTVGSLRKPGTSVITEDICFDVEKLADVIADLHAIFDKWNYEDAVIFGHAKDGNLHFVASIDLETDAGIKAYERMLADIGQMTVSKYDGSLKAEHGTGRNMAPFVEQEWGSDLYEIMWRIKELSDPQNILNPDVLLNRDPKVHIKSLKPLPLVNEQVDLCVECGFCEPVCPSRNLTFTPRNRIAVAREIETMKSNSDKRRYDLIKAYNYKGTATCAADGLCETACPVNIDTGSYVKKLRFDAHSSLQNQIADWTVTHFNGLQKLIRFLLNVQHIAKYIGLQHLLKKPSELINWWSNHVIPVWNSVLPAGARVRSQEVYGSGMPYIYYTSCINRTFNASGKKMSLTDIIGQIAAICNIQLIVPERINDTCCGTPYGSKGFKAAYSKMVNRTITMLFETSHQGEVPIIVDTSPCTYQFINMGNHITDEHILVMWNKLKFIDIIPFLHDLIAERDEKPLEREVVLHPTCSTQKMDQVDMMVDLARNCARTVHLPEDYGCCAFAGDRGMLIPELTASATRKEAEQVKQLPDTAQGISTSRTCEVGMMSASDRAYESIALLVRDYLTQIM